MGMDQDEAREGPVHPDTQATVDDRGVSEEDAQRAQLYGLLARLLTEPMSDDTLAIVRGLDGAGDDTELGKALATLGTLAVRTTRAAAEDEFSALFFGMGSGGEVSPYGSQYLTGFVYDKPLTALRQSMSEFGIQSSGKSKEPEDHIAYICEIMHGLITGRFGKPADLKTQKKFFETHVAPWAGRFFADLEGAEAAKVYMPVGTIGRLLIAIEAEAFSLVA